MLTPNLINFLMLPYKMVFADKQEPNHPQLNIATSINSNDLAFPIPLGPLVKVLNRKPEQGSMQQLTVHEITVTNII